MPLKPFLVPDILTSLGFWTVALFSCLSNFIKLSIGFSEHCLLKHVFTINTAASIYILQSISKILLQHSDLCVCTVCVLWNAAHTAYSPTATQPHCLSVVTKSTLINVDRDASKAAVQPLQQTNSPADQSTSGNCGLHLTATLASIANELLHQWPSGQTHYQMTIDGRQKLDSLS